MDLSIGALVVVALVQYEVVVNCIDNVFPLLKLRHALGGSEPSGDWLQI